MNIDAELIILYGCDCKLDTNMDIVKIIKSFHLKATYASLSLKQKFFLLIFLFSFIPTLVPQQTAAAAMIAPDYKSQLVFDTGADDYLGYLAQITQEASDQYYAEQLQMNKVRQQELTDKVKAYLQAQNSPLADYAFALVTMRNWKKIVALANAESSLCRHYPVDKANCWGVGGSNLWDMGDNLAQGLLAMNHFLNTYPKGPIKYSQMSFDEMNGLYKQPAAEHWAYNAQTVYDDLSAIENSL